MWTFINLSSESDGVDEAFRTDPCNCYTWGDHAFKLGANPKLCLLHMETQLHQVKVLWISIKLDIISFQQDEKAVHHRPTQLSVISINIRFSHFFSKTSDPVRPPSGSDRAGPCWM